LEAKGVYKIINFKYLFTGFCIYYFITYHYVLISCCWLTIKRESLKKNRHTALNEINLAKTRWELRELPRDIFIPHKDIFARAQRRTKNSQRRLSVIEG